MLDAGAIGDVTHILGEAYGPVVLKPKGGTWRSQRTEGGGCLYDYAAHVIDLVSLVCRASPAVSAAQPCNSVFSREIDDEVFSTLYFPQGKTGQLSVNWSDESYRKMTTRVTIWGTAGRIYADRQECQIYLRDTASVPSGYEQGWNVRYTTELTEPVWFYLRGEEYSAQIDYFVQRIKERRTGRHQQLPSAAVTDKIIAHDDRRRRARRLDLPRRRRDPLEPAPARPRLATRPAACAWAAARWRCPTMDRLLFGDNQFFGVNHMSEEKARAQALRFQDIGAVIEVLDAAYEEGMRTFMCTTHDRIALVCDHVRAHPERYPDYVFYPGMPYAHKYANAVTEDGMLGAVKRFLPDEGLMDAALRGGASMAKKDIEGMTTLLIDAEMKMFQGLRTPVIFLQNVVVDLLLGLGFKDAFRIFAEHVKDRYNAEPGFITMNLPALLDVLEELRDREPDRLLQHQQDRLPHVRRHRCLRNGAARAPVPRRRDVGVRLGGNSGPEAIEWVCAQPNIASIVFGASSRANIRGHPGIGFKALAG